eukprot:15437884-Alexandrium_andersonii.AAC.1
MKAGTDRKYKQGALRAPTGRAFRQVSETKSGWRKRRHAAESCPQLATTDWALPEATSQAMTDRL